MKFRREWLQNSFLDLTATTDSALLALLSRLGRQASQGPDGLWDLEDRPELPPCRTLLGLARELSAGGNLPFRNISRRNEICSGKTGLLAQDTGLSDG